MFRCALRGGSFNNTAAHCALGYRNHNHPGNDNDNDNNGFRLVVGEVSHMPSADGRQWHRIMVRCPAPGAGMAR